MTVFLQTEDVWSCRRLEEDGFSVKEQGQVKISSGEEVCYQESFCSIEERFGFEGPGFEGFVEKCYSREEVVKEVLEDSEGFERVIKKVFSDKGVAKKVFSEERVVKR